jgi:hypothetical protein
MRIGELDARRQRRRRDVAVGAQTAVRAVMGALGQGFRDTLAAGAVLAHGGGLGAGPIQAPAGSGALGG